MEDKDPPVETRGYIEAAPSPAGLGNVFRHAMMIGLCQERLGPSNLPWRTVGDEEKLPGL